MALFVTDKIIKYFMITCADAAEQEGGLSKVANQDKF